MSLFHDGSIQMKNVAGWRDQEKEKSQFHDGSIQIKSSGAGGKSLRKKVSIPRWLNSNLKKMIKAQ